VTLFISEQDVNSLLDMSAAIDAVEDVIRWQGQGKAGVLPRSRLEQAGVVMNVMAGAVEPLGRAGLKAYTSGSRMIVNLFDMETGELLAVIEAGRLGQIRTGAATGVSVRYLSRPDANTLGLIGTGYQAETQLEAVAEVANLSTVKVYSRQPENRANFIAKMSSRLDCRIVEAKSARDAGEGSDIVVTATNALEPVLSAQCLRPGVHVVAMGGNRLTVQEIETDALGMFDLIAVDDLKQGKIESADLIAGVHNGYFDWADMVMLGEVVAGLCAGRTDQCERTLFKSLGIGTWDVAVADLVFKRATSEGFGRRIAD
tara:strand:+ start:964 stop:1908 length:945 start_codon:yes stop_codon:yes gene_type:complete